MIMASMRNWLHGGELHDAPADAKGGALSAQVTRGTKEERKKNRVVVVHCKAGKGRSGTVSCSYLIAEEGWKPEDALARFTKRRMRPSFGAGVSIPSQLRWVSYMDRWTRAGKKYIDRPIEIVEIHVWGLRNGVKVDVEGFAQEGKKIQVFHTFKKEERMVVEGGAPEGLGLSDMMWEMAGYSIKPDKAPEEAELAEGANAQVSGDTSSDIQGKAAEDSGKKPSLKNRGSTLISVASATGARKVKNLKSKTFADHTAGQKSQDSSSLSSSASETEPGGMAVILKPKEPVRIPNSDVNISVEARNRTRKSLGMTMVTAVGHVWFNAFFEGRGPEQDNKPSQSGVFSIEWDAMDGIKGTSRKGSRALDRMAVVWRVAGLEGAEINSLGEEVIEPPEGIPVPQTEPADWKGGDADSADIKRTLGLRTQSPNSADISKASSVRSLSDLVGPSHVPLGGDKSSRDGARDIDDDTDGSLQGVKTSGPFGEKWTNEEPAAARTDNVAPVAKQDATKPEDILEKPDEAEGTTKPQTTNVV